MEIFLIKSGLLMAVIGILVGLPFIRSIKKNNEEQWRIAHLSGIVAGTFTMVLGLVYSKFCSPSSLNWWSCLLINVSNWLFLIGTLISGFSGKRGLSTKDKSISGRTIFVLYSIAALLSTLVALGLLLIGLW